MITEPPVDQFVINNGFNAVFSCGALAVLNHTVSWTFVNFVGAAMDIKNNDNIIDTKYSIVGDRDSSMFGELTVINVAYEDRGVYTCSAANSIGTVTASANLTVHDRYSHAYTTCIEYCYYFVLFK